MGRLHESVAAVQIQESVEAPGDRLPTARGDGSQEIPGDGLPEAETSGLLEPTVPGDGAFTPVTPPARRAPGEGSQDSDFERARARAP